MLLVVYDVEKWLCDIYHEEINQTFWFKKPLLVALEFKKRIQNVISKLSQDSLLNSINEFQKAFGPRRMRSFLFIYINLLKGLYLWLIYIYTHILKKAYKRWYYKINVVYNTLWHFLEIDAIEKIWHFTHIKLGEGKALSVPIEAMSYKDDNLLSQWLCVML